MPRDITIEINTHNHFFKMYPSTNMGRDKFEYCYGIGTQSVNVKKTILVSTLNHFLSQNMNVVIQGMDK